MSVLLDYMCTRHKHVMPATRESRPNYIERIREDAAIFTKLQAGPQYAYGANGLIHQRI